jgi:hypothetical protein
VLEDRGAGHEHVGAGVDACSGVGRVDAAVDLDLGVQSLTLVSVRGINDCPPKPGSMVMTSARSHASRMSSSIAAGVLGLIAAPDRQSSARIDVSVRCRFGHTS